MKQWRLYVGGLQGHVDIVGTDIEHDDSTGGIRFLSGTEVIARFQPGTFTGWRYLGTVQDEQLEPPVELSKLLQDLVNDGFSELVAKNPRTGQKTTINISALLKTMDTVPA